MGDHDRERETTVIHTDSGGGGGGTLIAVVLLIAVIALLFYLFGGQLLGGGDKTDVKVDVEAPATGGSGSCGRPLTGGREARGRFNEGVGHERL